jgi:hypothetical protein
MVANDKDIGNEIEFLEAEQDIVDRRRFFKEYLEKFKDKLLFISSGSNMNQFFGDIDSPKNRPIIQAAEPVNGIRVGAVTPEYELWTASAWGPGVPIYALGSLLRNDISAQENSEGTSFAAGLASSWASLIVTQCPEYPPEDVKLAMFNTARPGLINPSSLPLISMYIDSNEEQAKKIKLLQALYANNTEDTRLITVDLDLLRSNKKPKMLFYKIT